MGTIGIIVYSSLTNSLLFKKFKVPFQYAYMRPVDVSVQNFVTVFCGYIRVTQRRRANEGS